MQLRLLRECPCLTLSLDVDHHWLYADWCNEPQASDIREGAALIASYLQAEKVKKLLNDNTRVKALPAAHSALTDLKLLGILEDAGLQYIAWVYPTHIPSQKVVDYTVNTIDYPVTLTFNNLAMATEWLRTM